jgi:hypothetical protein
MEGNGARPTEQGKEERKRNVHGKEAWHSIQSAEIRNSLNQMVERGEVDSKKVGICRNNRCRRGERKINNQGKEKKKQKQKCYANFG